MNYRNEFKKRDCKILDYYNKISVIIKNETHLICYKKEGKTDYKNEIKNSFLKSIKKGLIK